MANEHQEKPTWAGDESSDTNEEQTAEEVYPGGIELFFVVAALMLSVFISNLDITIVATAIPKITDEFGSISQVSWYGSAFFITNGSFQSAWGKAYKFFDLKWTFLLSLFIFELGSLICAVAPSSVTLIVGRAIAGIGCAGLATGGFTIIAFLAPPAKRPLYTGFVGIAFGIASVLGPLLGGVFTTGISWRWCFWINLPIGGLSAIIIWFFFKVPPAARPTKASFSEKMLQMDAIGVILMLGSLLAYGLAMQQGGQSRSWGSSEIIGLLVGFPVIMAAFIAWEYVLGRRAMLDLDLVSKKTVGVSGLFAFFFAGSYFVVIYYLPLYFQSIHGRSALGSGVDNLPLIISATVAALAAAGAVTRYSNAKLWVEVAGAVVALVGAGLLFSLQRDTSTGKWIGYQIVGGLGWGASFQLPIIIAQSAASASDLPSVTAIILFFLNVGGGMLNLAAQAVFAANIKANLSGVDVASVLATGATELRDVFKSAQVPEILDAYMSGIKGALGVALGSCGVGLVIAVCDAVTKEHGCVRASDEHVTEIGRSLPMQIG